MSSTRQTRLTEFFELEIPTLEEETVEITISAPVLISNRLPELSEEQLEKATSLITRQWMHKFMAFGQGWTHAEDIGVTLQIIDNKTVRCIAVCDAEISYDFLAFLKYGFEELGFSMQIDPYAIVMNWTPNPIDDEINEAGMNPEGEKEISVVSTNNVDTFGMEVA